MEAKKGKRVSIWEIYSSYPILLIKQLQLLHNQTELHPHLISTLASRLRLIATKLYLQINYNYEYKRCYEYKRYI